MDTQTLFGQLGIALLLGLLVGLQREHGPRRVAGMRTFPLITILGTLCAALALEFGGWIVAAGLLAVVAVIVVGTYVQLLRSSPKPGTTTDAAVLVMYAVGAFLVVGPMPVAIAVGASVAVLLQFKIELHRIADRLGDDDLKAIMQFVLLTCIILPVVPNQTFGPLDVFNPWETWLIVVLIVGISLGGYIIYKFFGRAAGILLGGLLGGMISSTATTVSYSRLARDSSAGLASSAIVIMIASSVVFIRVLVEVAVVGPVEMLRVTVPPIMTMMLLTLLPAVVAYLRTRRQAAPMPEQKNPTQLRSALFFGVVYTAVLFLLAASREYVGSEGLYMIAVLSGLTDMDAITLSTARMAAEDAHLAAEGWRLIVAASMSNMVFKAGVARLMGGPELGRRLALWYLIPLTGGGLLLLFL